MAIDMSTGPSFGAKCAHRRVEWCQRTVMLPNPLDPSRHPVEGVSGWWECADGCGMTFSPDVAERSEAKAPPAARSARPPESSGEPRPSEPYCHWCAAGICSGGHGTATKSEIVTGHEEQLRRELCEEMVRRQLTVPELRRLIREVTLGSTAERSEAKDSRRRAVSQGEPEKLRALLERSMEAEKEAYAAGYRAGVEDGAAARGSQGEVTPEDIAAMETVYRFALSAPGRLPDHVSQAIERFHAFVGRISRQCSGLPQGDSNG